MSVYNGVTQTFINQLLTYFFLKGTKMAVESIEEKSIWGLEFDVNSVNFGRFRSRRNDSIAYASSITGVVSDIKLKQNEKRENLILQLSDRDTGDVETIFLNFNDFTTYNIINALVGLQLGSNSFNRYVVKIGAYPRRNKTTNKLEQGLSLSKPSTFEQGKWELVPFAYGKDDIPQTKKHISPHTGETTYDSEEKKHFWREKIETILMPVLFPERFPQLRYEANPVTTTNAEQTVITSQTAEIQFNTNDDDIPF